MTLVNAVKIDQNATLNAAGNVNAVAHSTLSPSDVASSGSGGLFAGASGGTFAEADYQTNTTVDGTVTAGNTATVGAHTSVVGSRVTVSADVGGLGVDGTTNATICIGTTKSVNSTCQTNTPSVNQAEIQGDANLTANHLAVQATFDQLDASLSTRTHATALGANSEATGVLNAGGTSVVQLDGGSKLVGNVDTALKAESPAINLYSKADASCSCLGGNTSPSSTINGNMVMQVSGLSGSQITTSDLTVATNQVATTFHTDCPRDGGFLDFGGSTCHENGDNMKRLILWESKVIMLGEPNPSLIVDASGNVTQLVNMTVHDGTHTYVDDPFAGTHTTGPLTGTTITVDDIIYNHGANARFLANAPTGIHNVPNGEIWGDLGQFQFQQTWDYVKLINNSNLNLETHIIDVVDTVNAPVIQVRVGHINDDATDTTYSSSSP